MMTLAQQRSAAARKGTKTRKLMKAWRLNKAERERFSGVGTTGPERETVASGGPHAARGQRR